MRFVRREYTRIVRDKVRRIEVLRLSITRGREDAQYYSNSSATRLFALLRLLLILWKYWEYSLRSSLTTVNSFIGSTPEA